MSGSWVRRAATWRRLACEPVPRRATGVRRRAVASGECDAEDGVGFLVGEAVDGADEIGLQFAADFLGEAADFIVQTAVGECRSWKSTRSAMRSTSKGTRTVMLMAPTGRILTARSTRTGPCGPMRSRGRQADHLRAVKEELARAALAGVHGELRDGLAEQSSRTGCARAFRRRRRRRRCR